MIAIDYDPITRGYIAGLPRPGGHITGLFFQQLELTDKRLEFLKEALPQLTRVAVLWDAFSADQLPAAEAAARGLGVHLQPVELRNPPYDYASVFSAVSEEAGGSGAALDVSGVLSRACPASWSSWAPTVCPPFRPAGICGRGRAHGLWGEL